MRRLESVLRIAFIVIAILKLHAIIPHHIDTTYASLALIIFYPLWGAMIFKDIPLKDIFKKRAYRHMNPTKLGLDILTGVTYSLIIIGMHRSIELWSPHKWTLIIGMSIQICIAITNLLYSYKIKRAPFTRVLKLSVFWLFLGIIFLKSSTLQVVKVSYRENKRFVKAYELYYKDPSNRYKRNLAQKIWREDVISKEIRQ